MRYFIIAGEASGDLHASHLIRSLLEKDPEGIVEAWGGTMMQQAGAKILKNYQELAFMGFYEVVKNLSTILANFKICKQQIIAFQPDVLILVDYPGFNLRMAKWAKKQSLKVFYYISPQIWAWHQSRVHQIKRNVDRMFVILPFEKDFYAQFDYAVHYVGHPLLDHLSNYKKDPHFRTQYQLSNQKIIALLPGSRKQEIQKMLATMLAIKKQFPTYQFVIAGAPNIPSSFYTDLLINWGYTHVKVIQNDTYALLNHSHAALVTSGTATLETALFEVPQVVCYTGNSLSYHLAKRLIKVKYISLVNLILDKEAITELIQDEFAPAPLSKALSDILEGTERAKIIEEYQKLKTLLGTKGASARTAELMMAYLKE